MGSDDPATIYLVDFGLSDRVIDNGTHIKKVSTGYFNGNFLFASLGSCLGQNRSRNDDIESLLYLVIYYLNDGYLPWIALHDKYRAGELTFADILDDRLDRKYFLELRKIAPPKVYACLFDVFHAAFDAKPDYTQLKRAFNE